MNLLGAIIAQSSLRFRGAGRTDGVGGALGKFPPHGVANGVGGAVAAFAAAMVGHANGIGGAAGAQPLRGNADGVGAAIGYFATVGKGQADGIGTANVTDYAAAFLARTSGLDSTHVTAYKNLINGLVGDGVWSALDALYIFATQDSTTAGLNLVSSNYTLTPHGSPTFAADHGYTGVSGSTTVYLDTGFVPSTAGGNFTQNSAHIACWSNLDIAGGAGADNVALGSGLSGQTSNHIIPRLTDGKAYFRINDDTGSASAGVTVANAIGHFVAARSGSSAQKGYKNASDLGVISVTSAAASAYPIAILAFRNSVGGYQEGFGGQLSAASFGGNLAPAQVTALYNRLSTYRTAVGL